MTRTKRFQGSCTLSARWSSRARGALFVSLLVGGAALATAQEADDRAQMRGLDEQIQEIKSDVLDIAQELSRLEETLLFPSGTQVAIFVALADGDPMRLDAVRLRVDDEPVAHAIYSFKELEALRRGGVQRIYVGNVSRGEHRLEVRVDGVREGGESFSHTGQFVFRKEAKPGLIGLTLAGPDSGDAPITIEDW